MIIFGVIAGWLILGFLFSHVYYQFMLNGNERRYMRGLLGRKGFYFMGTLCGLSTVVSVIITFLIFTLRKLYVEALPR